MEQRIVVAITGASGAIYGLRLLEMLKLHSTVETHLIVSKAGFLNLKSELGLTRAALEPLAHRLHGERDIGATIASGSFRTQAMIVAPCSMRTLAAIATGLSDGLVARAADVTLKERRRLVLMPRETPLNLIHLRNMVTVTEMGGVIFPPMPAFYARIESLDAMVDQTVARVLELVGIETPGLTRWAGLGGTEEV
jgi:4-hydroxy-3-polyprenylbenzoate decarboxylase